MGLDVEALRAETPGCANVVHLNNAGAALPTRSVLKAVVDHLRLEAEIGGYEAADAVRPALEHTYDAVASLIGAKPDEIALVENATRGWDMAFYALQFCAGDRILTSVAEYASNAVAFLQVARRTGAVVEVVPDDQSGQLSVSALEDMVDERTRLIAITHVPTHSGLINPAAEVGRVAREAGVPYLLDACQSVGQLPVDVDQLGCDFLSATGRKFLRAPRGTGFLYVRRERIDALEPPFLDLYAAEWVAPDRYEVRPDARRFESWESSVACRLGLAAAVDHLVALGVDAVSDRILALGAGLRQRLQEVPGVQVHDRGAHLCGIVTFSLEGRAATDVVACLRAQGVNVSVSAPELAPYAADQARLGDVIRASVHCYNSDDELDRAVTSVAALR